MIHLFLFKYKFIVNLIAKDSKFFPIVYLLALPSIFINKWWSHMETGGAMAPQKLYIYIIHSKLHHFFWFRLQCLNISNVYTLSL